MLPIAFDVDGVLIDTDAVHERALNRALADVAGFTLSHAEHLARWKGNPTRWKLEQLVAEGRLALEAVEAVSFAKQAHTVAAIAELPPCPETRHTLTVLVRRGHRLCAVSNAVASSVAAMVAQANVADLLAFTLCNTDAKPKPAPDLYLLAARGFGVDPVDLIVVEDGAPGIAAARAAGCRVIEVAGPQDVTRDALIPRIEEVACE